MRPTSRVLALTMSAALLVSACGIPAGAAAEFPLTVENCGRQVTFQQRPERVLTIGTRLVNQVYAAGAADRIVARSAEYDDPPTGAAGEAVKGVPALNPDEPTLEQIIGSGVDLVIAEGLYNITAEDLAAAGIPVLIMSAFCGQYGQPGTADGASFDDVYADIQLYGQVLGTQDRAAKEVASLKERVAAVQDRTADVPFHTAAVIYDGSLSLVYGVQSMPQAQLAALGLDNVFSDIESYSSEASIEELLKRDPDFIVLVHFGPGTVEEDFEATKAKFEKLPGVDDLEAVRSERIVGLADTEAGPEVSAVGGLERLADQLIALT